MKLYTDYRQTNLARFFRGLSINMSRVVSAGLVHGTNIAQVGQKDGGKVIANVDGLITNVAGLVLTVTVADCLPLYFWDSQKQAVGIAHAGWRGVKENMALAVVEKMQKAYGCAPADMRVVIGPHIQPCHFEVGEDVVGEFTVGDRITRDKKYYIDLKQVVRRQLEHTGVRQIEVSDECTYCERDKYFSYRRDKPADIEAMLAYITMTADVKSKKPLK